MAIECTCPEGYDNVEIWNHEVACDYGDELLRLEMVQIHMEEHEHENWFLHDQKKTDDVLKMVLNIAEYTDQQNDEEVDVSFAIISQAMRRLLEGGERRHRQD